MISNHLMDIGEFHTVLLSASNRVATLTEQRDRLRDMGQAPMEQALEELHHELEELQVAKNELRIHNVALAKATADLETERLRYKQLFDDAPAPYLSTDSEGKILDANKAACQKLKLKEDSIKFKPLLNLIHDSDRNTFKKNLQRLKEESSLDFHQLRLMPGKGSTPVAFAVSAAPIRRANGEIVEVNWLLRPLATDSDTATKSRTSGETSSVEDQLSESAVPDGTEKYPELECLREFSLLEAQLGGITDIQSLLNLVCKGIARLVGDHSFLSLLSTDKLSLLPVAAASQSSKSDAVSQQFMQSKPARIAKTIAGKVLSSKQVYVSKHNKMNLITAGVRNEHVNLLMVPIRANDQSVGLITILRDETDRSFEDYAIPVIQHLADYLGIHLHASELEKVAKEAADVEQRHATFLYELSLELQGASHALEGFAVMVKEQAEDVGMEDMTQDAKFLHLSATHVNRIVTDLFALSRLELQATLPAFEDVSTREFIEEVETELNLRTDVNEVITHCDESLYTSAITTDRQWARQLIVKILAVIESAGRTLNMQCNASDGYLVMKFCFADEGLPAGSCGKSTVISDQTHEDREVKLQLGGVATVVAKKLCDKLNGKLEFTSDGSVFNSVAVMLPFR